MAELEAEILLGFGAVGCVDLCHARNIRVLEQSSDSESCIERLCRIGLGKRGGVGERGIVDSTELGDRNTLSECTSVDLDDASSAAIARGDLRADLDLVRDFVDAEVSLLGVILLEGVISGVLASSGATLTE